MYSSNQPCCSWQRRGMMVLAMFIPVVVFASFFGGTAVSRIVANADTGKLLRHVVQFKFKESSTRAQVSQVVDAFRALPSKISEIADFEHGQNNSPEGLENGFTHCFLVTFASEKDRQTYLTHAAHMQFVEVLKPHLDKVQVIDYWAGK